MVNEWYEYNGTLLQTMGMIARWQHQAVAFRLTMDDKSQVSDCTVLTESALRLAYHHLPLQVKAHLGVIHAAETRFGIYIALPQKYEESDENREMFMVMDFKSSDRVKWKSILERFKWTMDSIVPLLISVSDGRRGVRDKDRLAQLVELSGKPESVLDLTSMTSVSNQIMHDDTNEC